MRFALRPGLLLGVATSATQIEGGELDHSWNSWHKKGRVKDGADPARACGHYERWKEDCDLMRAMGLQTYRLGLEWARLEPVMGQTDARAVAYYRELLNYIRACGMTPLLTIHHFTSPMWFEGMGGFTKAENIPVFLSFVERVVRLFGDLADEYITINEPNVYALKGFYEGDFPPGEKSLRRTCRVMSVMASCHIAAYSLIHRVRREMGHAGTKVSFAHHARAFAPKSRRNPWHRLCTTLSRYLFQGALTRACCTGVFSYPLKRFGGVKAGQYCDFWALNYYSRTTVSGLGDGVREGAFVNNLGWEIYPKGIVVCAAELYKTLPLPIYITENGTCDNDDSFRSRYIYDHLRALCESGLPVERYYHWCFCDNFEWAEGESARFGLVYTQFATQERTIKNSGRFYTEIIRQGGVTDEMYEKYVAPSKYHR